MMKQSGKRSLRAGIVVYHVLLAMALVLALSLLGGTLYALVFRPDQKGLPSQVSDDALSPRSSSNTPANENIFTEIGRVRTSTAGTQPATVILAVTFPYSSRDKTFLEELNAQIANFRSVTVDYFGAFSADELRQKDEALIKAELLRQYNLLLRLGQLDMLYFNEYIIIE
jgi:flagellar basal body-associated protein FliL